MARITIGRLLAFGTDSVRAYLRGGAKGATVAADVTTTPQGADHQGLDVTVLGTVPLPTGAATETKQDDQSTLMAALNVLVTAVRDRLPGAFTAGLGVKVGLVDALPAGTAVIGHVVVDAPLPALVAGTAVIGKVDQGAAGAAAWPISDAGASLTVDTPQLPATIGQKAMAASLAVVVASDQSALPVTATQGTGAAANAPWAARLSDGASFYDGAKTGQLPTVLVGARLDVNNGAWLGSTAPTVGQKTMAASIPVVLPSDQSAIPVTAAALADGSQKAIVRGGAKGATTAADVTSTAIDADHQALDVSVRGSVAVTQASATAVRNGRKLVAVTNTAIALGASAAVRGLVVGALAGNGAIVYVGGAGVSSADGFELAAGQSTGVEIDDLAKVFVNGTAGDGVCFIGGGP